MTDLGNQSKKKKKKKNHPKKWRWWWWLGAKARSLFALIQVHIFKSSDFVVNDYTISDSFSMMKYLPVLSDGCTNQFEVFSHFITTAEADYWCIQVHACDKETCEMITTLSKCDRS